MSINPSAENYLETIYVLSRRMPGGVRAIDVANELGFSKPSVSIGLKHLRDSGLSKTSEQGFVLLTEEGLSIAKSVYERHTVLTAWLTSLGVDKDTAMEDACKIEHVISEQSFEAVKRHIIAQHHIDI